MLDNLSFVFVCLIICWVCRGRDHMVVGFTTTYAIGAYYHWSHSDVVSSNPAQGEEYNIMW
jgi:hypothetical protein